MDDMQPVSLSRDSSGSDPRGFAPSMDLDAPCSNMTMSRDVGQPVGEAAEQFVPAGMNGGTKDTLIWEGTTWDACPTLCMCCAPLCCLTRRWTITSERIELKHGCCGTKEDSIYVNRMHDVSLAGNCCKAVLCCGRNTIHIHSADVTHPKLQLTLFGARKVYKALRDAKGNHPAAPVIQQV